MRTGDKVQIGESLLSRSDNLLADILVVGAAVSVLVVVMMMVMRSGVVVFLIQGRGVGGAEALPLFFSLLQDAAVGQSAEPAQQLAVHL